MKLQNKPFGKPDAAKKGLGDLSQTIDVGDLMPSFSFHNDPTVVRILIGRKGTGKTHALKLLEQASNKKGNRTLLRNLDVDLTRYKVVQTMALDPNSTLNSDWERLWRFALATAALSRFTCREPDDSAMEALRAAGTDQDQVRADWRGFCIVTETILDPIGALIDVLSNSRNPETLANLVLDSRLEDLERFVSNLMKRCGPIHFLLDGFDEFEEGKPKLWLDIQLGLFWLAFRINTTRQQLKGVYLTVAVREGVLAAAERSQHADRFDYGDTMMLLTWNREAAVVFFRSLLWKVRSKAFWKAREIRDAEPETDWLGISDFRLNRPQSEPLIDYLIRHTRCTPRDLILIGNELASTFNQASELQRNDKRLIDRAVRTVSEEIADKAVRAAAEELVRDERFAEFSESSDEQKRKNAFEYLRQFLVDFVEFVGKEVFDQSEFRDLAKLYLTDALTDEPSNAHADALLLAFWRNGIIASKSGRPGAQRWTFIWSNANKPDMNGPRSGDKLGFHPTMFEIAKLKRSRLGPVY
jgi:hypothetical protein